MHWNNPLVNCFFPPHSLNELESGSHRNNTETINLSLKCLLTVISVDRFSGILLFLPHVILSIGLLHKKENMTNFIAPAGLF